jgi:hypothetical protein
LIIAVLARGRLWGRGCRGARKPLEDDCLGATAGVPPGGRGEWARMGRVRRYKKPILGDPQRYPRSGARSPARTAILTALIRVDRQPVSVFQIPLAHGQLALKKVF